MTGVTSGEQLNGAEAERRPRTEAFFLSGNDTPDMGRIKRILTVLFAVVTVSFAVHYALFESFPLGKPQMLEDDEEFEDTIDVTENA